VIETHEFFPVLQHAETKGGIRIEIWKCRKPSSTAFLIPADLMHHINSTQLDKMSGDDLKRMAAIVNLKEEP
jgi:hypothetical protein